MTDRIHPAAPTHSAAPALPILRTDLLVIGGGPAGLAAALEARENGAGGVLILERDAAAGGILNQCIHNGFGLHYFKEELTGPEYAGRFLRRAEETPGIAIKTDTMVLDLSSHTENGKTTVRVQAVNPQDGYLLIEAGAAVLAMGCRERTRGAIAIPGTRPAGVYTAGCAQRYINIEGAMPGRRAVILGSGDIGLIMARRLTLEGAEVLACVELMPYSGGLQRNITQCLEDFGIPLYLSHTITDIRGRERVEQVTVMKVDENRRPIPGTEMVFDCDTVLLSVGLIPENELSRGWRSIPAPTARWLTKACRPPCPGCLPAAMSCTFMIWWISSPWKAAGPEKPPPASCRRLRRRKRPCPSKTGRTSPTRCPSRYIPAGWKKPARSSSGCGG